MRKVLGMVVILLTISSARLMAADRYVLAEMVTNTGCPYCPPADNQLDYLAEYFGDRLVVIRYHAWWPSSGDPFYQANTGENTARIQYYNVTYTPHCFFDGIVDGTSNYSAWQMMIQNRMNEPSPLTIDLVVDYNPQSREGSVMATIHNEDDSPYNNVKLRFCITESDIEYTAPNGETEHNYVMRDYFPDVNGITVDIPAGETIVDTAYFTLSPSWEDGNCQVVVFVQNDGTREIYQSAWAWVNPNPALAFSRFRVEDLNGGDGDYLPEPGEEVDLYVALKNTGREDATSANATIYTDDEYFTVTTASASYGAIPIGGSTEPTTPFSIQISSSAPYGYMGWINIDMELPNGVTYTDSFLVLIDSTAGFFDDCESGEQFWQHAGFSDFWHLTELRCVSPTHSWYNGIEESNVYNNNANCALYMPDYILIGRDALLTFNHWYAIQENADFAYLEIDNGHGWEVYGTWTGTSEGWEAETLDLSGYAGSPLKMRFHFTSDGYGVDEGWYIDDISFGVSTSVEENPGAGNDRKPVTASIGGRDLTIAFELDNPALLDLSIYDVSGRPVLKKQISGKEGANRLHLGEMITRKGHSGVYFVIIEKGNETLLSRKVILFNH